MNKKLTEPVVAKTEYQFIKEVKDKLYSIGFENGIVEKNSFSLYKNNYNISFHPKEEGYWLFIHIHTNDIDESIKQLQRHIRKLEKIKRILEE